MNYLLQPQLFPFDEFTELDDDNSRLALVLLMLPDERLLRWLNQLRAGRRDDYPQAMLWRRLIAKFVYQIQTFAELMRELRRNGILRRMVGIASIERVPDGWHFSRFFEAAARRSRSGICEVRVRCRAQSAVDNMDHAPAFAAIAPTLNSRGETDRSRRCVGRSA